METKKELKTRSLRLSDDTSDRLKELAKELSINQEDVLVQLLQTFEMDQGKAMLPDRSKEISDFESYTELLKKMYIRSLEDYATLEEKVLLKYEDKLKSKDDIISDLQGKVTELQQIKEQATQTAKKKTEESAMIQKDFEEFRTSSEDKIRRLESNLEDKDGLIEELKDSKNTANEQIAALTMELSTARMNLDEVDTLKKDKITAETELENANKQIQDIQRQMERADKEHEAAIELEKQKTTLAEEKYQSQTKIASEKMAMEKEKALMEQEKKFKEEKDTDRKSVV